MISFNRAKKSGSRECNKCRNKIKKGDIYLIWEKSWMNIWEINCIECGEKRFKETESEINFIYEMIYNENQKSKKSKYEMMIEK